MKHAEKNQFFDISRLPPKKGLLLFGLSMNKLANRQNASNCLDDLRVFHTSKISQPSVGVEFIYSDFLYLYNNKPSSVIKNVFMDQVIQHTNSIKKLLYKNRLDFQIQEAFNYLVWNQLYVGTHDFNDRLSKLRKIYETDTKFQELVKKDCEMFNREMEENQVNFFLEEWLMMYLLTKGKVQLPNDFIQNNQEWVLFCYPGNPLRGHVYLYQLNPFNFEWKENPYQNAFYNLDTQKLIEFENVDLATYNP